jgi:hypothetical protein
LSLLTVVFLILLVLKLAGIGIVATWSWWLVTLPLWIGFAIGAGLLIIGCVLAFLGTSGETAVKALQRNLRKRFKRK